MVLAPHVQWLMAAGFSPFEAAAWRAGGALAEVLWKDVLYVAGGIGYVTVVVAVYSIAVAPTGRRCGRPFGQRTRTDGC